MHTEIDLDKAIAAGIIDEDQAIRLRNLQAHAGGASLAAAEKFQLFGGLADIMTAAGLALLAFSGAMLIIASKAFVLGIPAAFAMLRLANRIKMRAAPALAMVVTVSYFGFAFLPFGIIGHAGSATFDLLWWILIPLSFAAIYFAVVWTYWRRFRFPPTLALIAAGYIYVTSGIGSTILRQLMQVDFFDTVYVAWINGGMLAAGVAVLVAAVWWDITDVRRETDRSQVAFWLHCCAGYWITHSVLGLITNVDAINNDVIGGLSSQHIGALGVIFAICTVVSLLLDRRSLVVGMVVPITIFFAKTTNENAGLAGAGAILLAFSFGWRRLRSQLMALLPTAIAAQLPRTDIIQQGQRPTRRHFDLARKSEHWRSLFN